MSEMNGSQPTTVGGNKSARVRVNVSYTTKGIPSYEFTVEIVDDEVDPTALVDWVLEESDRLRDQLKARYGSQQEGRPS